MEYQKDKLIVRRLESGDNVLLAKWLSDPAVLEYYEGRDNPFDLEKVNEKFYGRNDGTVRCLIKYEDVGIGYIQYYEVDEEGRDLYGYDDRSQKIYGMDQFIGEIDYWNKGIGTLLVRSMVDFLVKEKQANRVVMDPQSWNERAIRCYEKCGFRKIKLMPKNEYHEGEYRDCWLIEYSVRD
ncbi:GNAT family N-acetyltransferase [Cytobacillus sp. FJAT-54145]|uniref:GNAT family N-acetyltransferase n=1 Tax=Cytobacillus spartinae TaxID=3299023 RepID=A0ABW6KBF1_9BACI